MFGTAFKVIISGDTKRDLFLKGAQDFYNRFPQDHKITTTGKPVTCRPSLLSLLSRIAQVGSKTHNRILIVSHATTAGLKIKIGSKGRQCEPMALLLQYARIERVHDQVANDKDPERWLELYRLVKPDGDFDIVTITDAAESALSVVKSRQSSKKTKSSAAVEFENAIKQIKKSDSKPAEKQKQLDQKRSEAETAFKKAKKTLLTRLGMSESECKKYLKELRTVHKFKLNAVEIRGCNLGKSKDYMELLCIFLGADRLTALKVDDIFGGSRISIDGRRVNFGRSMKIRLKSLTPNLKGTAAHAGVRIPRGRGSKSVGGGNLGAHYYNPKGKHKRSDEVFFYLRGIGSAVVAEDLSILQSFAKAKFGATGRVNDLRQGQSLPFQLAASTPFYFPQDSGFEKQLVRVTPGFRFQL